MNRAAVLFFVLLTGTTLAETVGVPVAPVPKKDTVEPIRQISTITNRVPAVRYPFARGHLQELDVGKQLLTLAAPGGPYHFRYESRTYIFLNKQKVTADALKPGDRLAVSFVTNAFQEATIRRIKAEREEGSLSSSGQ